MSDNNFFDVPANVRPARIVSVFLMLIGLAYVSTMHFESVANAVTPGDARAMQQQAGTGGDEYFPAHYVNQAQAKAPEDHIQAF